jgi:hypothetical protein
MAEENKSQKVVETYKAVAAGIASVLAAVFTSKLGVAGTLIGTALTATLITLVSAVLKVQLMKASDTVSGLPSAVQGRLSTQQIRIPGKPNAEPNPEPAAQLEEEGGGRKRSPGLLSRLRAIPARLRALPGFFRELPSVQRRKVLIAGLLAGLVATVIGLSGVTGIELAGGNTLSCLVWSCPEDETESANPSGRSGLSIFGGSSATGTGTGIQEKNGVPPGIPSSQDPFEKQPGAPESDAQTPQQQQQQPAGQPAQPGDGEDADYEAAPQRPGESPRVMEDPGQPEYDSEPASDQKDAEVPSPGDRQSPPQRGAVEEQGRGTQKDDRG